MKILVCLEESEQSRSILPIARRLANLNSAQVDLVHVVEFEGRTLAEEDAEIRQSLHRCLEGFPAGARSVVLHERNAAQAIITYAQLHGTEIIAMASRARPSVAEALLGSTTHAVLRSGVAPVLVLNPREKHSD
jgi:nucleotide-binding universal stress UspA family protein